MTTPPPDKQRSPGRPALFDADEVVAKAVQLFWQQGFDGTSVGDLEQALGLNRSTLYASFDGKAGLYEAAVAAYVASMEERLLAPLFHGDEGLADLVGFVGRLRDLLTDPANPDGCLIVNAMGSGRPPDATERYLDTLRAALESALTRAAERGEIAPGEQSEKAAAVLAATIGLNVMAKSAATDLDEVFDGVEATITGWAA